MPIQKGSPWGRPGALPAGGVVVTHDSAARQVLEEARRRREPYPPLGLLGGDLCRTLGGPGSEKRLRSSEAVTFTVDLGQALIAGSMYLFIAHLVARNRWWSRSFAAMNAQWLGTWNLGPRAHPNDGLIDSYDARLRISDLGKVRRRLNHGAHLPHPGIVERRAPAVDLDLERVLPVWLDGARVARARRLAVRVEPDALTVVV